jgi:hemolysin III
MEEMLHKLHVSPYPPKEEIVNVITHGLGVILAGVGFYFLLIEANLTGDPWKLWSSVTFGLCMITCYLCSTLYHAFTNLKFKHYMRIADHIGIYLLIAGSYTPFILVNLRGWIGWTYFVTIWGCAVIGIILRVVNMRVPNYTSVAPYLIMGWLAAIGIKPLYDSVGWDGLSLVLLGGIFYSLGVIFYMWKRIPFNHAIWHLFVLAGSISHYFAVFFEVITH